MRNQCVIAAVRLVAKVDGILHMEHLRDPRLPFYNKFLLPESQKDPLARPGGGTTPAGTLG